MDSEIGLFADEEGHGPKPLRPALPRRAGRMPHRADGALLALVNYVAYDLLHARIRPAAPGPKARSPPPTRTASSPSISATDNSNLVITDGERVIWQRAVPLGGNHFHAGPHQGRGQAHLRQGRAPQAKRRQVPPTSARSSASLKPVLNDFVGEVQRSLGYFTNTHRDANIQYLVGLGGGFRQPGLQKFLQEKLQHEVKKVSSAIRSAQGGRGPVVAAIHGEPAQLRGPLRPGHSGSETSPAADEPAAARRSHGADHPRQEAVGGRGGGGPAHRDRRPLVRPRICSRKQARPNNPEYRRQRSARRVEQAKQARKRKEDEVEGLKKELASKTEEIRRITTGLDERFNWHLLMQYVNCTIPQPNGSKLVDISSQREPIKAKYYTEEAKRQARVLAERKRLPDKQVGRTRILDWRPRMRNSSRSTSCRSASRESTRSTPRTCRSTFSGQLRRTTPSAA